MADDRPIESIEEHSARIERELNEFKQVMTARMSRRPVGDIEATIRTTPKQNTLICDGSTIVRVTYQGLWEWAQEQGLVGVGGLFGAGDGSTTFKLPDMRGRVLLGAGTLGTDTYSIGQLIGSSTVKLATEHMPAHSHPVTGGTHWHGGMSMDSGVHGNHRPGTQIGAGGNNAQWATNQYSSEGNHRHGFETYTADHSHATSVVGGSTGNDQSTGRLENRQPSIAVNYLIWF